MGGGGLAIICICCRYVAVKWPVPVAPKQPSRLSDPVHSQSCCRKGIGSVLDQRGKFFDGHKMVSGCHVRTSRTKRMLMHEAADRI